jgi:signal transduction histidine kinase
MRGINFVSQLASRDLSLIKAGSWVGLSIVKQSVNLHGGKITVKSKENVGTTFTGVIPVRELN